MSENIVHKKEIRIRSKEVAHDETPSMITDHKFSPKGEWWSLCRHCNVGEAAHVYSELRYYSDDVPEDA